MSISAGDQSATSIAASNPIVPSPITSTRDPLRGAAFSRPVSTTAAGSTSAASSSDTRVVQ